MDNSLFLDNATRLFYNLPIKSFSRYLSYLSPAWATKQWFGVTLGILAPFEINFPEEPATILANICELRPSLLMFGPRQWESLASCVHSHMLDAGAIRRFFYNLGMKIGHKVAAGRTERRLQVLYGMLIVFLVRPHGLFGWKIIERI